MLRAGFPLRMLGAVQGIRFQWFVGLLILAAGVGCGAGEGRVAPVVDPVPYRPAATGEPTQAQPRLPSVTLFLGNHQLTAEVARTSMQIRTGMMFRPSIGEDEGMLFVFSAPHRASFWMKNVKVELSVAYLDPEGRILEIHDLEPGNENPVASGSTRVQYALETARGWFERRGLAPGVFVTSDSGPLSSLSVRRR